MLLRLSALTPVNTRGMWVGTFHGLCNRMLRAHYRDANLPQLFQILDTQDQLALIKRLYSAHNIDDERFPPRQLQWFIAEREGRGPAPEPRSRPATSSRAARSSTTRSTRRCASARAWSISPSSCCAATSCSPATRRSASTTSAASRTCSSTSSRTRTCCSTSGCGCSPGPHTAVFAVGDDDQSIYAFRGANVANMQHFERDFATADAAGAADQARAELPLARPHPRRRQRADPAQPARLGKNLWTSEGKGEPVRAFAAPTDLDEAAFVVDVVEGPRRRGRARSSEVALLYRSQRAVARARARAVQRRHCRTASTAACASSSAPRSSTRSPTCASSPRRTTTARSCASSISRRAASARARSSSCRTRARARARRLWQAACERRGRRQGGQRRSRRSSG